MDQDNENKGAETQVSKTREKPTAGSIVSDVVGADDWKRSKLGYLTGLSPVFRVIGNQFKAVLHSVGRISLTFKLMTAKEEVPSLPDVEVGSYDGRLRFVEAMRFHGMSEGMIVAAQSNTKRSAYLYAAILCVTVVYFLSRMIFGNPIAFTTLLLHLAPIPIFTALGLRAIYYNWMFRHRTLEPIRSFFRSRDWMPK